MIRTRQTTVGRELERLLRDGVRSGRGDAQLLERYLDARDEAAFEILVERHGPLVLSLCRRYLRDPRDVEDAFQATFLILIRKGSSLRDRSSLSSWLYGVAYRVAVRARSDVLKRRNREGERDGLTQAVASPEQPADDSLETLDAELSRLPEKYRAPLVLCYLEGRTHEQAAAELGWPVGTVRSRMARARAILETRLTRRGFDASACLAFLRPDYFLTSTALPAITSATTSWPATALAQGVLAAMMISQLKWIGVGTTAFGLLAATAGVGAWAVDAPAGSQDSPRTTENVQATEKKESPEPTQPARSVSPVSPPAVEARLAEMERKIDQITALLQRMEERSARPPAIVSPSVPILLPDPNRPDNVLPSVPSASPAAIPAPAPAAGPPTLGPQSLPGTAPVLPSANRSLDAPPSALPGDPGDAPRAESVPVPAPDRRSEREEPTFSSSPRSSIDGGLREIEARLINASERCALNKALYERAQISRSVYMVPIEEARVLIARLKGIEDQLSEDLAFSDSIEAPRLGAEFEKAESRLEDAKRALQRTLSLVERNVVSKSEANDADSGARIALYDVVVKKSEVEKLKFRKAVLETRLKQARSILKWAGTHFKELPSLDGPAFSRPVPAS